MSDSSTTHVYYLLDESGSMEGKKGEIVRGMNEFLQTQQKIPGCFVSLFSFSDRCKILFENMDAGNVPLMDFTRYHPDGTTALYDAMGFVLETKVDCSLPGKHVFIVLTDGEENASSQYSRRTIQKIIASKKQEGLEVLFLGSNQDAVLNGTAVGTVSSNCLQYTDDRLEEAMRCVTQNVFLYRNDETETCGFTDIQRAVSDSTQNVI